MAALEQAATQQGVNELEILVPTSGEPTTRVAGLLRHRQPD